MVDFRKIEKKWQKKWEEKKIFEAEPDSKKKKYYMLFAYPTVSGSLHVGHCRSYALPDIVARYKKLKGFNVFFPLGFHATGVDTLKILKAVKEDSRNAKKYGIREEEAKAFETPLDVEQHLEKSMIGSFKTMGMSLDYRASVSTIHPQYNRFIQWQFRKLKERNYVIQKDYRIPWCPNCDHPVSLDAAQADLSEGADSAIKEFTIIKFRNEYVYPASTLRTETVFGVTNLWVNPEAVYVYAKVNGEKWVLSKHAVKKLENLKKETEIELEVKGNELVGKCVENPVTKKQIKILGGSFVDADEGTGIVMSVPAHDPFDYIFLKDVSPETEPIQVIELEGYGKAPAKEIVEKMGITKINDSRIEDAKKMLYKLELEGRMLKNIPQFGGLPAEQAREKVKEYLEKNRMKDIIYEFSKKPVVCRCGTPIIIRLVKNQWFLDYTSKKWKDLAKDCVSRMKIYPEDYKKELPSIIDWLAYRPCVRRAGLGTEFPFEKGWIIEPLSDSTVYMAFYIVSKYFNSKKIKIDELTDEFFNYVFLGRGKPKKAVWKKIREEFQYWYPLDLNMGGKEHKSVHFPYFIFHHAAIFPEKDWPKGIFLNWHVLAYGEKMSKSKGNVVFWKDAIDKWGADTVRLYLAHGAHQWSDFDWRNEDCDPYVKHINNFYETVLSFKQNKKKDRRMDSWINSRFNSKLREISKFMESGEIRKSIDASYFGIYNDIVWYRKRSEGIPKEIIGAWIKLLSPFIPHVCEELWEKIGGKGFVSEAKWPEADEKMVDGKAERAEELVRQTLEDIKKISKIVKIKPKQANIYVSPEWKYDIYSIALKKPKNIIQEIMKVEAIKKQGNAAVKYAQSLASKQLTEQLLQKEEFAALKDAEEFFARELGIPVKLIMAEESKSEKAQRAEPGKPGIEII